MLIILILFCNNCILAQEKVATEDTTQTQIKFEVSEPTVYVDKLVIKPDTTLMNQYGSPDKVILIQLLRFFKQLYALNPQLVSALMTQHQITLYIGSAIAGYREE